jgi:hydroxymethylbilane synthase
MSLLKPLRIGARGSPLSLAQTGLFRASLEQAHPGRSFEIVPIVTTGDKIQDRLLIESGGKGLFTKELDEALLDGRIDLAVHSMKDLPTQLPDGIVLGGVPKREDPRDALICEKAASLLDLPPGARIGTASLRRQAQLLSLGRGFDIVMLRGNVETRLRKVASGEMDATLLAYAGLRRLGLSDHARSLLDPEISPPAAGQGALAVTARAEDLDTLAVLSPLNHLATLFEITAERAFLAALDGSCRTPIAALGRCCDGQIGFIGEALTPDGRHRWRRLAQEPCTNEAQAASIGLRLGAGIRQEAGDALYTEQTAAYVS